MVRRNWNRIAIEETHDLATLLHARTRRDADDDPILRLAFERQNVPVRWLAADGWIHIRLDVSSGIIFSLGDGPWDHGLERRFGAIDTLTVYAPLFGDEVDEMVDPSTWLSDDDNRELIRGIRIDPAERAHVAIEEISLDLRPSGADRDLERIDATLAMARHLPAPRPALLDLMIDTPIDAGDLPAGLSSLAPLIPAWSISDDEGRAAAVARASDADLLTLWTVAGPRLSDIDAALDADDSSDISIHLHAIAQAAIEARLELGDRGVTLP